MLFSPLEFAGILFAFTMFVLGLGLFGAGLVTLFGDDE